MDPVTGLEAYKQLGVAALFIAMYLATIAMFIRDLRQQRKAAEDNTEQMVRALEASTQASSRTVEVLREVNSTLDAHSRQLAEFVAWLRGRDGE